MAATHNYVSSSASGGDGSSGSPFTLQEALDAIDTEAGAALITDNHYIWVKADGTYDGSDATGASGFEFTAADKGNLATNLRIHIIGYSSTVNETAKVSDLDIGEVLDCGVLSTGAAAIAAGKLVDIDGGGDVGATDALVQMNDNDNVTFRNIYFHNVEPASESLIGQVTSDSDGTVFINCKFDAAKYSISFYGDNLGVIGCWSGTAITDNVINRASGGKGIVIANSYLNIAATKYGMTYSMFGSLVLNSVFNGGGRAVDFKNDTNYAINCLFYNQSTNAIYVSEGSSQLVNYNNIYLMAAANLVPVNVVAGSQIFGGYNCGWSLAGVLGTPIANLGDLNEDPRIMNITNKPYPQNERLLRMGMGNILSGGTNMGTLTPEVISKMTRRTRYSNASHIAKL